MAIWSYLDHKPADIKAFLADELNVEGGPDNQRFRQVQEIKIVNVRTAYAAVYQKSVIFDGVCAYVILLDYPRSRKSADKFGYKILDETAGPTMSQCPKSILNKLSALPDGGAWDWARQWRARCAAHHALVAQRAVKRKPGTRLVRPSDGLTATVVAIGNHPHGCVLSTPIGYWEASNRTIDQFEETNK
jgi:hypothetical protein